MQKYTNPLDKHNFYRPCKRDIVEKYGIVEGVEIWSDAGKILSQILKDKPGIKEANGAMVVPAVAIYKALELHGKDAVLILKTFGQQQGEKFASIVHVVTSLPGIDKLIWNNVDRIMHRMSSPGLGYQRKITSNPPEMYGVDILSCPFHELAKQLGAEDAVLCICSMDKAYMQGFHHIRYERSTAVSEGAECCDYQLLYDLNKE